MADAALTLDPVLPPERLPDDAGTLRRRLLPPLDRQVELDLAARALQDHADALTDRAERERRWAMDDDQYHGILPVKTFPWKGCFLPGTDLLTRTGWCPVQDVKVGMEVFSLHPETRATGFMPVEQTWHYPTTPYAVRLFQSRGIDMTVTPEHRILLQSDRNGRTHFVTADTLLHTRPQHKSIPLAGAPCLEGQLPPMPARANPMDWFELWGWYLSEGSWDRSNNSAIIIAQSQTANPGKRYRIEALLNRLPFSWSPGKNHFYVNVGPRWRVAFAATGNAAEKRIPAALMDAPAPYLRAFMAAFWLGDGSQDRLGRRVCGLMAPGLVDDLQAILARMGDPATIHTEHRPNGQHVTVLVWKRRTVANISWVQAHRVEYTCENWCVSTPWGTVFARQNGVALFIGQCANFHVPLTRTGVETLKPRLIESVLGDDQPILVRPVEATDEARQDITERFLNWQVMTQLD